MRQREVACANRGCAQVGIVRRVGDIRLSASVVARPPLFCAVCDQAMADAATPAEPAMAARPRPEPTTKGGRRA